MAKRKPAEVNPAKIFAHAAPYSTAYHHLRETSPTTGGYFSRLWNPLTVLASFAAELYLKCFIALDTGKTSAGHDLRGLYLRLSPAHQRAVEAGWADFPYVVQYKRLHYMRLPNADFSVGAVLEKQPDIFQQVRYAFEADRPVFGDELFHRVHLSLRNTLLTMNPEWAVNSQIPNWAEARAIHPDFMLRIEKTRWLSPPLYEDIHKPG